MSIKQLVLGTALLLSVPSFAQQAQLEIDGTEKPQEIKLLELAGKLVRYGQDSKSALPLVQAVQIFRKLNVVEEKEDASGISSYESQLLAEATNYANGNKALLDLINDIGKVTRAGARPGPIRYVSSIGPDEVKERRFYAEEGKYISVVLDGQGEGLRDKDEKGNTLVSDLRLTVLDRNGHTLATDQSAGENCSVNFISRFSSTKTIEIKNVGQLSDDYVLYIYCN